MVNIDLTPVRPYYNDSHDYLLVNRVTLGNNYEENPIEDESQYYETIKIEVRDRWNGSSISITAPIKSSLSFYLDRNYGFVWIEIEDELLEQILEVINKSC